MADLKAIQAGIIVKSPQQGSPFTIPQGSIFISQLATSLSSLIMPGQYNAVVGSAADVTNGIATHSSLNTAINDPLVPSGGHIYWRNVVLTETVTVSKTIKVMGSGSGSQLNGAITFTNASIRSHFTSMNFVTGSVTINVGASGNIFQPIWRAVAVVYTDNGTDTLKDEVTY